MNRRLRLRLRLRLGLRMPVHGEPPFASRMHCDHEPTVSSPSPPVEERAGERRPLEFGHPAPRAFSRGWSFFGSWSLGFGISLELGAWDLELPLGGSWEVTDLPKSENRR